jgi:site-specific recombinase XerD
MGKEVMVERSKGIYPYERIFNSALNRLQSSSDINQSDKTCILKLVEHLLAKGVSKLRTVKYINHLIVLARMANKPLELLGREDVEELVRRINMASYTDHTKHDYKVILKKFFQWMRGFSEEEHEYPDEVKWIKTAFRNKRLLPEALLSTEELKLLVEATENPRDRALILTHYESGCARAQHPLFQSTAINREATG